MPDPKRCFRPAVISDSHGSGVGPAGLATGLGSGAVLFGAAAGGVPAVGFCAAGGEGVAFGSLGVVSSGISPLSLLTPLRGASKLLLSSYADRANVRASRSVVIPVTREAGTPRACTPRRALTSLARRHLGAVLLVRFDQISD